MRRVGEWRKTKTACEHYHPVVSPAPCGQAKIIVSFTEFRSATVALANTS